MSANPSNIGISLPRWDTNEVQSALDENTVLLNDWETLITKNEKDSSENITRDEINRHNYLKRKLHENLGLMAKMVQSQLKPRLKTETTQLIANTGSNSTPASIANVSSMSSLTQPQLQNQIDSFTTNINNSQNMSLDNTTSQSAPLTETGMLQGHPIPYTANVNHPPMPTSTPSLSLPTTSMNINTTTSSSSSSTLPNQSTSSTVPINNPSDNPIPQPPPLSLPPNMNTLPLLQNQSTSYTDTTNYTNNNIEEKLTPLEGLSELPQATTATSTNTSPGEFKENDVDDDTLMNSSSSSSSSNNINAIGNE